MNYETPPELTSFARSQNDPCSPLKSLTNVGAAGAVDETTEKSSQGTKLEISPATGASASNSQRLQLARTFAPDEARQLGALRLLADESPG